MSSSITLAERILTSDAMPHPGICTVAFSGGADSTALLLCLHDLREQLDISLRAVHVHHGIRGDEADRDAAFCADLCARYDIAFQTVHVDVPAYAQANRLSLETAARKLRYEALQSAAPEGDLATAHHAGDNAETILFHLIRGSGMNGLCGIPPRNGRIIRPLLYAEKSEMLRYLEVRGQDFVEDSTNFLGDSSRNRIRHGIIPLLMQENPAFLQHISRTAEILSADSALLVQSAKEAYQESFDAVSGGLRQPERYAKPVRMRMYMMRLAEMPVHIDPSYEKLSAIDALLANGSGKICVSGHVYAERSRGILYITAKQPPDDAHTPLLIGTQTLFDGKSCTAQLHDTGALSQNYHKAHTKSTLDFDKIKGRSFFRQWRGADRLALPGRGFSSQLKTCIQAEIPAPQRRTLYVLYDDLGCIYCEGIGIAARVKPDANSRRILTLSISAANQTTKKE